MSAERTVPASSLRGFNWNIWQHEGNRYTNDEIQTVLLQEIRDELKKLNGLLHCDNFIGIPTELRGIRKQLAKPRRRKAGTR